MAATRKRIKSEPANAETMRITDVERLLGVQRWMIYDLVELGYFTDNRNDNPASDRAMYLIFADEVREYQRVKLSGISKERQLTAMKSYRDRMGRL